MPTTTTGEAPVGLESSTRTLTVGVPVTTGTSAVSLGSSGTVAKLTMTPSPWIADVSQQGLVSVQAPAGIGRVLPPLATPPAHLTIPGIPFSTDPIAPLTVDSDGRVHSDGT